MSRLGPPGLVDREIYCLNLIPSLGGHDLRQVRRATCLLGSRGGGRSSGAALVLACSGEEQVSKRGVNPVYANRPIRLGRGAIKVGQ